MVLRYFLEADFIGHLNDEFFISDPNGNDTTKQGHYEHYYQLKPPNPRSRTCSLIPFEKTKNSPADVNNNTPPSC
jgi:hypothetical protein